MSNHQDTITTIDSAGEMVQRPLTYILDIPIEFSAEIGSARLLMSELVQLGQGSVIELDKLAGDPVEVRIGGKLIGHGESVVVNGKYGVRLIQIISPADRIKQLG